MRKDLAFVAKNEKEYWVIIKYLQMNDQSIGTATKRDFDFLYRVITCTANMWCARRGVPPNRVEVNL